MICNKNRAMISKFLILKILGKQQKSANLIWYLIIHSTPNHYENFNHLLTSSAYVLFDFSLGRPLLPSMNPPQFTNSLWMPYLATGTVHGDTMVFNLDFSARNHNFDQRGTTSGYVVADSSGATNRYNINASCT